MYIVIAVVGSFGLVAGLLHTSNLNNHLHHVATYSVASYPGRVGGEKCFAPTTWPRYEAMYIVNYLSSILYIPSDNTHVHFLHTRWVMPAQSPQQSE